MSSSPLNSDHGNGHNSDQLTNSANSMNSNCNNANNGFTNSQFDSTNKTNEFDGNVPISSSSPITPTNQTSLSTSTTSTTNSSSTNTNNGGGDDVCRDFLRNVCRRGKACRYKHPDLSESEALGRKETYVFCHDYQNRECRRENCRFLHCTKQEEELFRSTGKLPSHVQAQLSNDDTRNNGTPVCKDFLNGTCRRAPGRCKFRHPVTESFHNSQPNRNAFDNRNGQRGSNFPLCSSNSPHSNLDYPSHFGRQQCGTGVGNASNLMASNYGYGDAYNETPNKRKRTFDSMYNNNNGPYPSAYNEPISQVRPYPIHSPNQTFYGARNQPIESRSFLEEENAALRRRIDDLKKQVSDLISTNDFLMEQINQFRVQNATGPTAAAVAVAAATSVASLPPQAPPPGTVSSTAAAVGISAPLSLQAQIGPPPTAAVIGALPPSSIVSSIASISLPTVTAPVSLVNSSAAASLVSYTPSLHSSNPWPLGVDQ